MGQDRKNKDKEMAARLKREGRTRNTAHCPLCHYLIALARLPEHLFGCTGRRRG